MSGRSPHRDEVQSLRERGSGFLEVARGALTTGRYNISCFLSEQAAQLHLKSVLLETVGDYPRTHRIRELLAEASKTRKEEIQGFVQKNRTRLIALEDAYIISRYTSSKYTNEDAEDMIKLAKEILNLTAEV